MNKLSKEKRNQLMLAGLVVATLVAGIYFTLIRYQQGSLASLAVDKEATETRLAEIRDSIKNIKQIEAELLVVSNKLALQEEDMPSGDLYASMVGTLRKFKLGHRVEIPQFNSPGTVMETTLLPKFPYKQVVMTVVGTAHYHDLGKFIADFENEFPTARIANLDLSPASVQSPDEKEKLSFKLDIVSLVKAGAPVSITKL